MLLVRVSVSVSVRARARARVRVRIRMRVRVSAPRVLLTSHAYLEGVITGHLEGVITSDTHLASDVGGRAAGALLGFGPEGALLGEVEPLVRKRVRVRG